MQPLLFHYSFRLNPRSFIYLRPQDFPWRINNIHAKPILKVSSEPFLRMLIAASREQLRSYQYLKCKLSAEKIIRLSISDIDWPFLIVRLLNRRSSRSARPGTGGIRIIFHYGDCNPMRVTTRWSAFGVCDCFLLTEVSASASRACVVVIGQAFYS